MIVIAMPLVTILKVLITVPVNQVFMETAKSAVKVTTIHYFWFM